MTRPATEPPAIPTSSRQGATGADGSDRADEAIAAGERASSETLAAVAVKEASDEDHA